VATDVHETIVALGNVFPIGPQQSDVAEIAVIVDDAWHGAGVGLLLTERLIEVARRMGFRQLVAYVLADNRAMLKLLAATELTWITSHDHDLGNSVVSLVADLDPPTDSLQSAGGRG
jgi:GNAT superfamily N-acetyltransferase